MLGDIPIVVDWIGGAVVGLLVAWLWNMLLKVLTQDPAAARRLPPRQRTKPLLPPVARQLISAAVGVAVGAGAVVAFVDDGSSSEGDADETLEVLVVWSGSEQSAFEEVAALYGPNVRVDSAGPGIADRLDELFEEGNPPDVAIIPQPSVVKRLASLGRIEPIEPAVAGRIPEAWRQFVRGQHGRGPEVEYGVFVKGAFKSLFWYHPAALPESLPEGATIPQEWSWAEFSNWIRDPDRAPGFDAPLTLAVSNEWPLTDWFENHLAALDPVLYDSLAKGETTDWNQQPVRNALLQLADLWQSPGIFDGGSEEVSHVELEDLTTELSTRDAALMFAPSFVAGMVRRMAEDERAIPIGYPRVEGRQPNVVGGDIAVVTSGSSEGHRFVRWLTDQEAMGEWAQQDPGFLTPNVASPYRWEAVPPPDADDDAVHVLLTSFLVEPAPGELRFDLSDEFGGVNKGRPCIVWRIFWNFFQAVTADDADEAAVRSAVDTVVESLNAEAQGLEDGISCDIDARD